MARYTFLLPPSRVQHKRGNKFAPDVFDYREKTTFNYFHELIPERRTLIDAVHRAIEVEGEDGISDILGSGNAVRVMRNVYSAELMAARKRYAAGPMYSALDFTGLPTGAQRFFLENSLIISGLFGLVRPDDLMPEYLLPIDADIPGFGSVTEYWRPIISPLLNALVEDAFVWDLLEDVHRAAWDDAGMYSARARVRFVDRRGLELADSQSLRGKLIHHIAQQKFVGVEAVQSWKEKDSQGFRLDLDRSSVEEAKDQIMVMSKR